VVVIDISLAGWLISSSDTAAPYAVFLAVVGLILLSWYSVLTPKDRTAHFEDQGPIAMELIAAIAMFGVVLVIVGVAFDAARRAK
jgi:hypothetical protein